MRGQERFDHATLAFRVMHGERVLMLDLHYLVHDSPASFEQCEQVLVDRL